MTVVAYKLNKRGSIRKQVMTPTASGGTEWSYEIVTPIWMELKPVDTMRVVNAMYIRGTQVGENPTHVITVRRSTSLGVDFVATTTPRISGDYVVFVNGDNGRGRMFKILGSTNVKERNELIEMIVKEIEEQGQTEFVS